LSFSSLQTTKKGHRNAPSENLDPIYCVVGETAKEGERRNLAREAKKHLKDWGRDGCANGLNHHD